jgi:glucokinase
MKKEKKEKSMKMFSLLMPIEDYKRLDIVKQRMRFTTTQQAVRFLILNPVTLHDADELRLTNLGYEITAKQLKQVES